MKIIITGSDGRLGKKLREVFSEALHTTRNELDFFDREAVYEFLQKEQPDVIIHAGAQTGIVNCDKDKEKAWSSNVLGTENLVWGVKKFCPDCHFIFLSTPCVFDGKAEEIAEDSIPNPSNFYGVTKLCGELLVRQLSNWCIVRSNFVMKEKYEYPKSFSDRYSNYLMDTDLAKAIKDVVEAKPMGIIHLVGSKRLSMYELSQRCDNAKDVQPTNLEEYYKNNPNSPKLTQNMMLVSTRWKKYKIGFSYE